MRWMLLILLTTGCEWGVPPAPLTDREVVEQAVEMWPVLDQRCVDQLADLQIVYVPQSEMLAECYSATATGCMYYVDDVPHLFVTASGQLERVHVELLVHESAHWLLQCMGYQEGDRGHERDWVWDEWVPETARALAAR